jgi:hypothetical protein
VGCVSHILASLCALRAAILGRRTEISSVMRKVLRRVASFSGARGREASRGQRRPSREGESAALTTEDVQFERERTYDAANAYPDMENPSPRSPSRSRANSFDSAAQSPRSPHGRTRSRANSHDGSLSPSPTRPSNSAASSSSSPAQENHASPPPNAAATSSESSTESRRRVRERAAASAAAHWVAALAGVEAPSGSLSGDLVSLQAWLSTTQVLAMLSHRLAPEHTLSPPPLVPTSATSPAYDDVAEDSFVRARARAQRMEPAGTYLEWCRALGVPEHDLFQSVDLCAHHSASTLPLPPQRCYVQATCTIRPRSLSYTDTLCCPSARSFCTHVY